MKVAIIGAGVVGVTTAYELAAQGHQVRVFERNSAAAEATSFANAGVVSAGYAAPWARPGLPRQLLSHLWQRDTPLRLGRLGRHELRWLWQFWKACDHHTFTRNREHMLRLALYSQHRMQALSNSLNLTYDRAPGYMVLLRSERERQLISPSLQVLRDSGLSIQSLNAQEACAIEPALNTQTPLVEALHFPDDEVSNCRQFTLLLKSEAEVLGARFQFNSQVQPLSLNQPRTVRCTPEDTGETFDAVVVCAGIASAVLTRALGLRFPLAAVHGYSLSAAVREPLDAPRSGVMDERYKVAISRLGQRIRVSGGSEFGSDATQHDPASIKTLYRVLNDWFPGAARTQDNVQIWKSARPMLADGPPILGASGVPGVWLNLGHGASGWTLACGSARIVADGISGRNSEINLQGLGLERLKPA
jgi:D-amino-acid dehydrogenase